MMDPSVYQTKSFHYCIYGLQLRTNIEIPNLIITSPSTQLDVDVVFLESEHHDRETVDAINIYSSPGIADNGQPFFKVWKQVNYPQDYLGIQSTNGSGFITFIINKEGTKISVTRTSTIPAQDMLAYFLGSVIGCLLSLRQVTCLHAGVIAVDGKALAIIGPKGAGKSTTTAALADHGLAVLSDDLAPLTEVEDNYTVAPGYLSLRLWPNTIDVLSDVSTDHLEKVLSIIEKRFLNLSTEKNAERWRFHPEPMRLTAVYVLNERGLSDKISIRPYSQAAGFLKLAGNVYPEYSLHASDRQRDFTVLAKLATNIPVRAVSRPDNLNTLSQLRDAILTDFKALLAI